MYVTESIDKVHAKQFSAVFFFKTRVVLQLFHKKKLKDTRYLFFKKIFLDRNLFVGVSIWLFFPKTNDTRNTE